MMGGAIAHYDGIVAFSQTDFTEDLKKITLPVPTPRRFLDGFASSASRRGPEPPEGGCGRGEVSQVPTCSLRT